MSGNVSFEITCPVPDVPLSMETSIDGKVDGERAGGPALALGIADYEERVKES